jgi:transcriptional regulator with XRE-family HTH domain
MTKLGERIRQLVDAKNLTHSWVATEAGITPATFSRILNGETVDPSFFTILRIAVVIDEPISAIAGDAPHIWSQEDLQRLAADSALSASQAVRTRETAMVEMPPRGKGSGAKRVVPVACRCSSGCGSTATGSCWRARIPAIRRGSSMRMPSASACAGSWSAGGRIRRDSEAREAPARHRRGLFANGRRGKRRPLSARPSGSCPCGCSGCRPACA